MRHRHELPWQDWERIAHFFPHRVHNGGRGRPFESHRRIVNGILWRLHTGAPWRDIPERYGPWETVYGRFRRWRRDGTWAQILTFLLEDLEQRDRLGHDLWMVDATIVRASRAAGGAINDPRETPSLGGPPSAQLKEPHDHALGYSRGGFGTKVHLLVTEHGIVLGIYVTPGQRHESTVFKPLLRRVLLPRHPNEAYWPTKLAADKGYSYPHIRRWVKRRRIEPVIPTRKDQPRADDFDKASYRKRNRIERVVGHYKECRALGTRYEKLAVDYVTLWMIAMIEKMLRLGHQTASADL
jgi:transposase